MEYRKLGDAFYVRMDRGDEMIATIMGVCKREGIASATYSGIGGCQSAEIQTFDPARGAFDTARIEGVLELVSFNGNLISDDDGNLHTHTHALFAFDEGDEHRIVAGHVKSSTVLYTAEIELRPVQGGVIGAECDSETGTFFWRF